VHPLRALEVLADLESAGVEAGEARLERVWLQWSGLGCVSLRTHQTSEAKGLRAEGREISSRANALRLGARRRSLSLRALDRTDAACMRAVRADDACRSARVVTGSLLTVTTL